ncbi:MAG TPA: aminotransferase class IV [Gemmatimonadales bacterium]|nr:aminotransferase class IV [Gemmatimonadales bacterium]
MITLIETVRVKGGKAPLWPYHLVRLARSAKALGIPVPTLVVPSGGEDRVVRFGISGGGLTLEERPLGATAPVRLGVATAAHAPYPHKTDERAQFDRALAEAAAEGVDDMLLLNQGSVAECAVWSCFWWEGTRLAAPPLGLGILPGVARAKLNELAGGIVEARVTPEEFKARGGFLANAARGVVAVAGVADAPGTVFLRTRFW